MVGIWASLTLDELGLAGYEIDISCVGAVYLRGRWNRGLVRNPRQALGRRWMFQMVETSAIMEQEAYIGRCR
jgi:hypothetical protein